MIINKNQYYKNLKKFKEKIIFYQNNEFFKILYNTNQTNSKAIIFLHGFNDNFYHFHISNFFLKNNFDIFALSLHNYGRSCYDRDKIYYTNNLNNYFSDIDNTLLFIDDHKKYDKIYLVGHSTGGITATKYCYEGKYKEKISGLILNSPFFRFDDKSPINFFLHYFFYYIGKYFPKICIRKENKKSINEYSHLVSNRLYFEEDCKLFHNAPIFTGWIYTVIKNQTFIKNNKLNINIPILILHSDKTYNNDVNDDLVQIKKYNESNDYFKYDLYSKNLGDKTEEYIIKNSEHDIFCSRRYVIKILLDKIMNWFEKN